MSFDAWARRLRARTKTLLLPGSSHAQSMAKEIPAFPYRQLHGSDIRLLQILPGKGQLECHLEQVAMDSKPMFYALSYAWGDSADARDILVEGRPFRVTKNLHEALEQFRQLFDMAEDEDDMIFFPSDYWWIDAVCINQADNDEKSRQVPRMAEIYHGALAVYAWLGPNKQSGPIERFLRSLTTFDAWASPSKRYRRMLDPREPSDDFLVAMLFEKAETMWVDWDAPEDDEDDSKLRVVFGEYYEAILDTAFELLRRPWFLRKWTIQESCLEAKPYVIAGCHTIKLSDLMFFLKTLAVRHKVLYFAVGYRRVLDLRELARLWHHIKALEHQGETFEVSAAWVLGTFLTVNGHCTDARDHVYGLLGLVTWITRSAIPESLLPDYDKHPFLVYWEYAAHLVEGLGDLRVLRFARHQLPVVPSWVPDFRCIRSIFRITGINPKHHVSISADMQTIHAPGVRMQKIRDYVARLDMGLGQHEIPSQIPERIRTVEQRVILPSTRLRQTNVEDILDVFMNDASRLYEHQGGMEGARRVYQQLREGRQLSRSMMPNKRRTGLSMYGQAHVVSHTFCRPLILLEDGTILSVREDAYEMGAFPSDIVCLLRGSMFPILLRPTEEGSDHYTFLSQCEILSGHFKQTAFDDTFWSEREVEHFNLV
ncbi:heterokaryon incompatibility protein-domain-containing protein [Xylariomycetidae sp. FL0641]|nr:heterokaryon incompatibility protein-domain-containing protein [Xylariomycetidae sp. FL0641]